MTTTLLANLPEEQAVPLELPAGVAFFCYGTPHATGPNQTERERAGVALHFLRADYAQDELIQPDRDYRPFLSGPEATGGLREYGEKVAGTWELEVERALVPAAAQPSRAARIFRSSGTSG